MALLRNASPWASHVYEVLFIFNGLLYGTYFATMENCNIPDSINPSCVLVMNAFCCI